MANKIIQLTNVNPLPKSNETLEKWVDIDMDAVNNWNHKTVEAPKLSDFVKILRTENLSKDDEDSLKAICAEKAIDATQEQISAIAVVCRLGYDSTYQLYKKWMTQYRWRMSKLVNVKSVQNSLDNIFKWIPGQRILNPEFGSNLRKYLYRGITPENTEQIIAEIKHCIIKWEPRVNVVKIVNASTYDDHEDNTIHLQIYYTIPELSDEEYSYSFYYNRGQ